MPRLARLAAGTIQPGASVAAFGWGLSECLARHGIGVQQFLSRAAFDPHRASCALVSRPRHLDSWLMDANTSREVFSHGTPEGSLGLVEGAYDCGRGESDNDVTVPCQALLDSSNGPHTCCRSWGGRLETLCDWLDLPKLVVLDVTRLNCCALPKLPADTAGLLLDGIHNDREAARLETLFFSLWGLPVLGTLGRSPRLRAALAHLHPGAHPTAEARAALASELHGSLRLDALMRLASRSWSPAEPRLFCPCPGAPPLNIAVAHDEVFGGYFQETLDILELRGARLEVFSPLRDETLPPDTDVVYFGCGFPEQYAAALAENSCLMLALREHLCSGRRMYGEGGGLAYLCQQIELDDGSRYPMVGALPAVARFRPEALAPEPVELTFNRSLWLGEGWSRIRGYLSSRWELWPCGPLSRYAAEPRHELDLVGRHHAIGSRVHINFAAQLDYLESFFQPHAPALDAAVL
jgi:cobyrinic acid a,c-diamide synthase